MKCNKCGAENPEGSNFCEQCGTRLMQPFRKRKVNAWMIVIASFVLLLIVCCCIAVVKSNKHRPKNFTVNGVSFDMVYVRGGTFQMGATSEQRGNAEKDEYPVHNVTLSDYYIGKYEVTQELWNAVMGYNPSDFTGDDLPVENVSWKECQTFINELNRRTGARFALPTEAQWEYAARGGRNGVRCKYSGSDYPGRVAWYKDNSDSMTHSVRSLEPNGLGLYHMSGNVYELCQDWKGLYDGENQTDPQGAQRCAWHVIRGGCWSNTENGCRVSNRSGAVPDGKSNKIGFRLVLLP